MRRLGHHTNSDDLSRTRDPLYGLAVERGTHGDRIAPGKPQLLQRRQQPVRDALARAGAQEVAAVGSMVTPMLTGVKRLSSDPQTRVGPPDAPRSSRRLEPRYVAGKG
jgi:hypothetical protein